MNPGISIERLLVTHRIRGGEEPQTLRNGAGHARARLVIETCLRTVTVESCFEAGHVVTGLATDRPGVHTGRSAYRLLLEIATGLLSAIPGETNVHGQVRAAWREFREVGRPGAAAALAPIFDALFDDVAAIRRNWLQNAGGDSYGSLVRRLVRPRRGEHILFVGAGDLMRSMLPLFERYRLGAWNHRTLREPIAVVEHLFAARDGAAAAQWADHVIMATPPDPDNDHRWQRWLQAANARTLVHLGHRRTHRFDWQLPVTTFDLDDVLALRRSQRDLRRRRLAAARAECLLRAHERATGAAVPATGRRELIAA